MTTLECSVGYRDEKWYVQCGKVQLSHSEWQNLMDLLTGYIKDNYRGKEVKIKYYFDMNHIPRWFHQYQTHYFNGEFFIKT